ncbi:MAG: hypothetical protein ABI593_02230 [Betaproteobacteria bacterium]
MRRWRWLLLAALAGAVTAHAAVPLGYRYVGSRVVSEGRAVYWYWHVDYVEIGPHGVTFVARLFARAVDVNQERPYVAVIRCDSRTYREFGAQGPYEAIGPGEPIDAVWRAGCSNGRAVSLAQRHAQLSGTALPPNDLATAAPRAAAPPAAATAAPAAAPAAPKAPPPKPAAPASPSADATDPRRADACLRFSDARPSAAGDGSITNACAFPIEVTLCYKGGGDGLYDCPVPVRGKRADSLGPGVTHALPEYRRSRHKGIAAVACKGTIGTVFPRLGVAGKSACR